MQINTNRLDFRSLSVTLAESFVLGVPGKLLVGSTGPQAKGLDSTNDNHPQFGCFAAGRDSYARLVGSRHSVNARAKLTGRLLVKAAEIPGNGQVVDPANSAYVPVVENKAYLTSGCEARVRNSLNL